jgi:hypothetical protein
VDTDNFQTENSEHAFQEPSTLFLRTEFYPEPNEPIADCSVGTRGK